MMDAKGPTVGLILAQGSWCPGLVGSLQVAVTVLVSFATETEKVLIFTVRIALVVVEVTRDGVTVVVGVMVAEGLVTVAAGIVVLTVSVTVLVVLMMGVDVEVTVMVGVNVDVDWGPADM